MDIDISRFKLHVHKKRLCFVYCVFCKKEGFEKRYYQTKNNIFAHIHCFKKAKESQEKIIANILCESGKV